MQRSRFKYIKFSFGVSELDGNNFIYNDCSVQTNNKHMNKERKNKT